MVLTVEDKLPSGNIAASAVFGYTLIHASILWPKIWNFQNPTGVVDFDLARQRVSISSSPRDGRHRAAEVTHKRSRWLFDPAHTSPGKGCCDVCLSIRLLYIENVRLLHET